jgi:crotonobetainyl-CoA:carnitine CoA-transferase CaiB-like acyl-CoA transferase
VGQFCAGIGRQPDMSDLVTGPHRKIRTPLTSSGRMHSPPPRQGEHTDAILREGGIGDDEIAKLRASGALR